METPLWQVILKTVIWPFAVIAICYIFMKIFRQSIEGLFGRIREISKKGIKTAPEQQQKLADTNALSKEQLMEAFDSPILREQENAIQKDLTTRGITDSNDMVKVLTRHFAATKLFLSFEVVDNLIWGSQIYILEELNGKRMGATKEDIKIFYDDSEKKWPQLFSGYPYDAYLDFLKNLTVITEQDGRLFITIYGVEFLGYLVKTGRSNARFRIG